MRKVSNIHTRWRRGTVAVFVAVTLTVMTGFTALAIDIGYIYAARAQLQTVADAAALAGASALADASVLLGSNSPSTMESQAAARAALYAELNDVFEQPIVLSDSDVSVGFASPENLQTNFVPGVYPYNAVRVLARKDSDSPNGPLNLFFGQILGKGTADIQAQAIAYFDQHVEKFQIKQQSGPFAPMSVRQEKWLLEIVNKGGDDEFSYDPETGQITAGPDGVPEVSIYPEKQKNNNGKGNGNNQSEGAGNFGLLNFNNGNNGTPILARQIRDGLTAEEIESVFGEPAVRFTDDYGNPVDHLIDGNPGLKASLKDDLESRLGQVIGFFVHTEVSGSGANAVFTVVDVQFGRLMHVDLTGPMNSKAVVIQPEIYTGREVITSQSAPIHLTSGRFKLIQ